MPRPVTLTTMTPAELAACLNISLVTILKTLVASSRYVLPNQAIDQETVDLILTNLGYDIASSALSKPVPENRRVKSNWPAWHANIRRRQLRHLYHFTARANLASIVHTGGLFSRRFLSARGIQAVQNDWGSAEKATTLGADYICLSLTKQWAMMLSTVAERAELPVLLIIEPHVIWYEGSCFSPGNSARRDILSAELKGWVTEHHFDMLFPDAASNWPRDPQAEILVRDTISLDDIRHIVFHGQDAFQAAWQDAGLDRSSPYIGKVRISERYFPADKAESGGGVFV